MVRGVVVSARILRARLSFLASVAAMSRRDVRRFALRRPPLPRRRERRRNRNVSEDQEPPFDDASDDCAPAGCNAAEIDRPDAAPERMTSSA